MTNTITESLLLPAAIASLVAGSALAFLLMPTVTFGQTVGDVDVTVRGTTATASFTLPTPCTPYRLSWGDGERVEAMSDVDALCIQVLTEVRLQHEYDADGAYTVVLTLSDTDETSSETITVPGSVTEFSLADVASITAEWVDPSAQMADEEYTVYTITLDNGTKLEVEVAGFTTRELRDQQFEDVGYTGDVAALIERATTHEDRVEDEPVLSQFDVSTVRALLQQILSRLHELLARDA